MFKYYFMLGLRSLRRNPALTALMVLTLAIGVAASVSTLTILHVMSGDPIPHKSDRLFVPVFDVEPLAGWTPGELPDDVQMSYPDAFNLLKGKHGERRTAIFGIGAPIEPQRKDLGVFQTQGLALTHDFFADVRGALPARPGLERSGGRQRRQCGGAEPQDRRKAVRRRQSGRPARHHDGPAVPDRRRAASHGRRCRTTTA